jgi:hypothetical protein
MLSRSANSEMDSPVDGRISAFNAAPGCVGLRLRSISDNPPGQPVSHPNRPSQKLNANLHLPERNIVPQSHAACENEIPEDSFLLADLLNPGCPTLSISAHAEYEEFFGFVPYYKTRVNLYGERNGSPIKTVTYHETLLQSVQTGSAITVAQWCENFRRKNILKVVGNMLCRFKAASGSMVEIGMTLKPIRYQQVVHQVDGLPKYRAKSSVIFWQDSTVKGGTCHEQKTLFDGADCRSNSPGYVASPWSCW